MIDFYSLLLCLLLTVVIELIISYTLGIRKRDLLRIIFINIITNLSINILLMVLKKYINLNLINFLITPILEIIVVLVEASYFKKLKNTIIGNIKLSILLNSFSYGYGLLLFLLFKIL